MNLRKFTIKIRISDTIKTNSRLVAQNGNSEASLEKKSQARIVKKRNAISRGSSKQRNNTEEMLGRQRMEWKRANVGGRDEAREEGGALARCWGAGKAFPVPREGAR